MCPQRDRARSPRGSPPIGRGRRGEDRLGRYLIWFNIILQKKQAYLRKNRGKLARLHNITTNHSVLRNIVQFHHENCSNFVPRGAFTPRILAQSNARANTRKSKRHMHAEPLESAAKTAPSAAPSAAKQKAFFVVPYKKFAQFMAKFFFRFCS